LGKDFIPNEFLPDGADEYSLRNEQTPRSPDQWRGLRADEIEALVKNANACDSWDNILVTEQFSPHLVKNCEFYGLVRIGRLEEVYLEYPDLRVPVGLTNSRIIACDTAGTLHKGRQDIAAGKDIWVDKWRICLETNADGVEGGIAEAMVGADVCIAFSGAGPGLIRPEWVSAMAEDAVVLACANPVPEIWPWEAAEAGARIVCSGRSDFPNQVNNSLCFPGVFRGVLDVQASAISEKMASAAAHELARQAELRGLRADCLLPAMGDWEVPARIAAAVGMSAQNEGLAKLQKDEDTLFLEARQRIKGARDATALLMKEGLIALLDEQ